LQVLVDVGNRRQLHMPSSEVCYKGIHV
jgi:hypothetical protein